METARGNVIYKLRLKKALLHKESRSSVVYCGNYLRPTPLAPIRVTGRLSNNNQPALCGLFYMLQSAKLRGL